MYKCAKCGNSFESLPKGIVRCPSCAHKVIFKERGPITKEVIAK